MKATPATEIHAGDTILVSAGRNKKPRPVYIRRVEWCNKLHDAIHLNNACYPSEAMVVKDD